MNSAIYSHYEHGTLFARVSALRADGPEFRFSGRIFRPEAGDGLVVDDRHSQTHASYLAVASRSGEVVVSLSTQDISQTWTVEPGRPLLILFNEGEYDYLSGDYSNISIIPTGEDADIEVWTFASDIERYAQNYDLLILNAGTGVTVDGFTGLVTHWVDTRPDTIAPRSMVWNLIGNPAANVGPTLIESDPDFGGRPSLDFSETSEQMFVYNASSPADDELFNFLRCGSQDFTCMAIMSVPDIGTLQYLWSTNGTSAIRAWVEGGYRTYLGFSGGVSAVSPGTISFNETIEKPSVFIWHYVAASRSLYVYWQGRFRRMGEASAAIFATLTGTPAGNAGALTISQPGADIPGVSNAFRGKIADIRWYNRAATHAERADYIAMAVSEYGIDNTAEQGFPFVTGSVNYHRANRGVEVIGNELEWTDTRIDSPSSTRTFTTFATNDPGVDDEIGARMVFHTPNDPLLGSHSIHSRVGIGSGGKGGLLSESAYTHLGGGGDGFSVIGIFWLTDINNVNPVFVQTGYYATGVAAGTDIESRGANATIRARTTDATDDIIAQHTSQVLPQSPRPYLVVWSLNGDAETYEFRLYDMLLRAFVRQASGSYAEEPSGTPGRLGVLRFLAVGADKASGSVPEFCTMNRPIESFEIDRAVVYANRRYTVPGA